MKDLDEVIIKEKRGRFWLYAGLIPAAILGAAGLYFYLSGTNKQEEQKPEPQKIEYAQPVKQKTKETDKVKEILSENPNSVIYVGDLNELVCKYYQPKLTETIKECKEEGSEFSFVKIDSSKYADLAEKLREKANESQPLKISETQSHYTLYVNDGEIVDASLGSNTSATKRKTRKHFPKKKPKPEPELAEIF